MNGRALRWLLSLAHRPSHANGAGGRLTIIRHHRVYGDSERPLYRLGVSESVFAAQLELLARHGRTPIGAAEGLARLDSGAAGHWVAMTFDDGYADNVTRALPLLERTGGRATFYLTAGWMEQRLPAWWDVLAHALESARVPNLVWEDDAGRLDLPLGARAERVRALVALLPRMGGVPGPREERLAELRRRLEVASPAPCEFATWDQAARLVASGMEVGAHTMLHPLLTRLAPGAQTQEIADSVALIERRLSVRPRGLAYPGGDHDAHTIAAARGAGLDYAVTTRAGANAAGAPRFELRRRGLSDGACLGPSGRFSSRLALAELDGAFDRLRGAEAVS